MAGKDAAFAEAGYPYPKNLTEIDGLPLVQQVIRGLLPLTETRQSIRFTFLVKAEEIAQFHTDSVLQLLVPDARVIPVEESTGGAACTALLAIETINTEEPLLICNGDMVVDANLVEMMRDFQKRDLDGGILVFEAVHPRWSYVKTDASGYVIETAEKRPISKLATAGLYYFRQGRDFARATMNMIKKDAHTGGQFYVCPAYNELILQQKKIGVYEIPRSSYHSLADPRSVGDYEEFLRGRK
jgi:dTDP-glucose pyrophosphorylase